MSKKSLDVTVNATKTDVVVDFESLYNDLCSAKCKRDLVDTMNRYGLRTTTLPTTTPNKNDLYVQFCEKSRVLFGSRTLKFYTCDSIANSGVFGDDFVFDSVNDGSYRTKRAAVSKSVDNFKMILSYFLTNYASDSYLPTK